MPTSKPAVAKGRDRVGQRAHLVGAGIDRPTRPIAVAAVAEDAVDAEAGAIGSARDVDGGLGRRNAGSVEARIDLDQDAQASSAARDRCAEAFRAGRGVHADRERRACVGKRSDTCRLRAVRPDRVREKRVGDRVRNEDLGLAERPDRHPDGTCRQLEARDGNALVRLGVRPEGDPAGVHLLLEAGDVRPHPSEVDDDARRVDAGRQRRKRQVGHGAARRSGRATIGVRSAPRPLDPEDDLVAGLEVPAERRVADLEQAAGSDRPACRAGRPAAAARPRTLARASGRTRTGASDHVRGDVSRRRSTSAVIARSGPWRPAAARRPSSSGVTSHGPIDDREVLALGRPEPDGRLVALEVARRPVVEDRVAADRLLGRARPAGSAPACRRGRHLELEVELGAPRGAQTGSSGPRISDTLLK